MNGVGWVIVCIGCAVALSAYIFALVFTPGMTEFEFVRAYWPCEVVGVAITAVGCRIMRREYRRGKVK